jgi:toxin ParE1/3/4
VRILVRRRSADDDLDDIFSWIAAHDPAAAERHVRRLVASTERLADYPEIGRARPEIGEGARSLVVGQYLVLYRVTAREVEIVRFVHGARDVLGMLDDGGADRG